MVKRTNSHKLSFSLYSTHVPWHSNITQKEMYLEN